MKFFYYILFLFTVASYSQNIIIGDSQVPFIDTQTIKAKRDNSLWKGGIGIDELTLMVRRHSLSTTTRNVIISVGTNDRYSGDVKSLYRALKYTFPYAKFYLVPGSWGWGGVKRTTIKDVNLYCQKHVKEGAFVIPLAIGPGDPHRNKESYVLIGQYIDEILTNN